MQENVKNKHTVKSPSGDEGKTYWNKWYLVVLLFLIAQIIIFHVITVTFK